MALSLHGLRGKIAAAAVVKSAAWRLGRVPGGTTVVNTVASRVDPGGETSDSYRGLLARLLYDTTEHDDGLEPTYDPVAGIIAGTATRPTPASELSEAAYSYPTAGKHIAAAAAYRKPTWQTLMPPTATMSGRTDSIPTTCEPSKALSLSVHAPTTTGRASGALRCS